MKRELLAFALISCLSFGFAGCSDDDSSSKKSSGNQDTECSAEKPCTDSTKTCNQKTGKCENLEENNENAECVAANFSPYCDQAIAVTGCSAEGKYIKEDCAKNTDGRTSCFNGECKLESGAIVECSLDTDCKDASKPYCSAEHVCVAERPVSDPCKDVTCSSGKCEWGICVDEKKKEGDTTCGSESDSYCIGDVMYYCAKQDDNSGIMTAYNCADAGAGTCIRADLGSRGFVVECSGNADMIKRCAESSSGIIDLCYGSENYYGKFMCAEDLKGNAAAIFIGPLGEDCAANDSPEYCDYNENNAPVCLMPTPVR